MKFDAVRFTSIQGTECVRNIDYTLVAIILKVPLFWKGVEVLRKRFLSHYRHALRLH